MDAPQDPSPQEPAPHPLGRALRIVVYVMLFASAGASFVLHGKLWTLARTGAAPAWLPLVAPIAFTLFVVVYSLDRWHLVSRRRYPGGRALFQVAFALVFLSLLWPQQASELQRPVRAFASPNALLQHHDAPVRAAACELTAFRSDTSALPQLAELAASDPNPEVRSACAAAVEKLHASAPEPAP